MWQTKYDIRHDWPKLRERACRKQVRNRLLQIIKHHPSVLHRFNNRAEALQKNHIRRLNRNVGPAAQSNSYISSFQRRGIINPITSHADNLVTALEFMHDAQFLLWCSAREDYLVVGAELRPLVLVEGDEFWAG